jgi:hypothetical protein
MNPETLEKPLLRRPVKKVQMSGGVGPLVLLPVPNEICAGRLKIRGQVSGPLPLFRVRVRARARVRAERETEPKQIESEQG